MIAIYALVTAFCLSYILWLFFLAVMSLSHARKSKSLTPIAQVIGYPILLTGYALDFIANVFVMTFVFLELPREWLVTARISRHIKESDGWRNCVAIWFRDNLLDPFDPGHCN